MVLELLRYMFIDFIWGTYGTAHAIKYTNWEYKEDRANIDLLYIKKFYKLFTIHFSIIFCILH